MTDSISSTLRHPLRRKAIPQYNSSTDVYSPVSPIEPDAIHASRSGSNEKQEISPQVLSEGSSNRDPAEDKHISWLNRKWQDWWISELLSALVGVLSLLAIIFVLMM